MLHIPDFQCPPPHSDSKHTQPFPLDTRNKCSWQFYNDRFAIDSINDGTQWLAKHYLVWQICKCTRRYYQPMTGTGWCMKTSGRLQKKNFSDYMKFYTTFIKVNYMHKNAKSLHRDNTKYEDSTKWGTKTWGQCFALRLSHSPNPLLPGQWVGILSTLQYGAFPFILHQKYKPHSISHLGQSQDPFSSFWFQY